MHVLDGSVRWHGTCPCRYEIYYNNTYSYVLNSSCIDTFSFWFCFFWIYILLLLESNWICCFGFPFSLFWYDIRRFLRSFLLSRAGVSFVFGLSCVSDGRSFLLCFWCFDVLCLIDYSPSVPPITRTASFYEFLSWGDSPIRHCFGYPLSQSLHSFASPVVLELPMSSWHFPST